MSKTLAESGKREIVSFVSETFLEAKRALWDFRFFMCAFAIFFAVLFMLSLGDVIHTPSEQHKAAVQVTESSEKSAETIVVPDAAPSKELKPDQAVGEKSKNDPAVIVLALVVFFAAVLFIITGIYFCYALYIGRFARDGFSKALFYNFLIWVWTSIVAWFAQFLLWLASSLVVMGIAAAVCVTFIWLGSDQSLMTELYRFFKQGSVVWAALCFTLSAILSFIIYEYFSARFSLVSVFVIAGEKSPIRKSLSLTKGNAWRIFAGGFLMQTVLFIGLSCLLGIIYAAFFGAGQPDGGAGRGTLAIISGVLLSFVNGGWGAVNFMARTIYNCVVCKALKEEANASSSEVL